VRPGEPDPAGCGEHGVPTYAWSVVVDSLEQLVYDHGYLDRFLAMMCTGPLKPGAARCGLLGGWRPAFVTLLPWRRRRRDNGRGGGRGPAAAGRARPSEGILPAAVVVRGQHRQPDNRLPGASAAASASARPRRPRLPGKPGPHHLDRARARVPPAVPVAVAVLHPVLAGLQAQGTAGRVGSGAHQRLGERLDLASAADQRSPVPGCHPPAGQGPHW
jgi:hypothetical protein